MKKFLIILIILALIISGAIVYLNKVFLPVKIKSLITSSIKEQTGKDVTLKSVEFSLFKGLVLKDLVIYDPSGIIASTRQASCSIFILPIFKKQIIIPNISFKSPYIFIERFADGSFNLEKILVTPKPSENKGFKVSVLNLNISSGSIVFQDDTMPVKLKKELKNIQLGVSLSLPASIKFNFKGELASQPDVALSALGQYKILTRELSLNASIKKLSLTEFAPYYQDIANLFSGLVDLDAQVNLKEDLLKASVSLNGQNLSFEKEKIKANLGVSAKADIEYNLAVKKVTFGGYCDIKQAEISTGMEDLGEIKDISGRVSFNQSSLLCESLKAKIMGAPFDFKISVKDFNAPVILISTDLDLTALSAVIKDKFGLKAIKSMEGKSALTVKANSGPEGTWIVQGKLNISKAGLKLENQEEPVEDISGMIEFDQDSLSWKDAKFKYKKQDYRTSGDLSNFIAPLVNLKLSSDELGLTAEFNFSGKKIKISQVKGQYLDSKFLITGEISSLADKPVVDLEGRLGVDLSNITKLFDKQFAQLKTLQPSGVLDVQFSLNGSLADFARSNLEAKITSDNFSLYGLKAQNLSMNVEQNKEILKITDASFVIYEGLIQGSGTLKLKDPAALYQAQLKADGIKLEKLKNDTPSKDKNISGNLSGWLNLNGAKDINEISGEGEIKIKEGRLWELNLLQGLGKLLFSKDLGNIEISDCNLPFAIKDKYVYTDKLELTGNLVNLYGPVKIGFDGSLIGALNVDIVNEMVPISGTLKDLATEIMGQGIFGTIKLSGTLKEPKYIFKPAVGDIIKGLKGFIFGK